MSLTPAIIVHNDDLRAKIKPIYAARDLEEIGDFLRDSGTFEFPALANGLFPASTLGKEKEYTGYANVWVRDNIQIAFAHYFTAQTNVAVQNVSALASYFQKHAFRFEAIVNGGDDRDMQRPHVRFDGDTMQEIEQHWAHAQNDALGYFVWLYCELATAGHLNVGPEEMRMLALFVLYFRKIRYWEDEDSGHWEEAPKIEASSIGVVVAALRKVKHLATSGSKSWAFRDREMTVNAEDLDALIYQGESALALILPAESIQPEPGKYRRYDSALLFLIFPLAVVRPEIARKILNDVATHLQGDYGIRRYLGDSYWAPDYKRKLPPADRTRDFSDDIAARDALLPKTGDEAQWSIFDPVISVIFGLEFQSTLRPEDLERQTFYLNRSLGQITGAADGVPFPRCPELYYLSNGRYVPNDHVPLLWTQANLMMALAVMDRSLRLGQPPTR